MFDGNLILEFFLIGLWRMFGSISGPFRRDGLGRFMLGA